MLISAAASSSSASPGRRGGRSGGFRAIVLLRGGELALLVYGFAKINRGNLRWNDLEAFRTLADEMLNLSVAGLAAALANGTMIEATCGDQAMQERGLGGRT